MSIQADENPNQHTLQVFDAELRHLNRQMLEMGNLIADQLEQMMQALNDGDLDRAEKVVSRDSEVNRYELEIDAEVLTVLAKQCPVANDLRMVLSVSKIADELERIGDEIAECGKMVMVLFEPKSSDPNPRLLTDLVKIGNLVKLMLDKLLQLIEHKDGSQAHILLQYDRDCESELQKGIRHQLGFVMQDARLIGQALDIMHIMKSLERCGEYCRSVAEHMIFMIEGVDIRHRSEATVALQ
ncbi:MAG: phosphate signaling complex protein PhoU [Methylococcales bacterium]|nr:phosphate signaling complex protein PhoU [Methylococcales bacterium]